VLLFKPKARFFLAPRCTPFPPHLGPPFFFDFLFKVFQWLSRSTVFLTRFFVHESPPFESICVIHRQFLLVSGYLIFPSTVLLFLSLPLLVFPWAGHPCPFFFIFMGSSCRRRLGGSFKLLSTLSRRWFPGVFFPPAPPFLVGIRHSFPPIGRNAV